MKILALLSLVAFVSCGTMKPTQQHVVAAVKGEMPDDLYNRLPASDCDKSRFRECKQARANDVADRYMLDHNGTLYRRINNATCTVTAGVTSFKISQHPNDLAVIYYIQDGHLHALGLDKERRRAGECPSVKGNVARLMENVVHYTVTSNSDTTIVNSALDSTGSFAAWDNRSPVYLDTNIAEFTMNSCYGQKGKPFNSFVLFTRDFWGNITKVKVENSSYKREKDMKQTRGYASIAEFKQSNNVCGENDPKRRR